MFESLTEAQISAVKTVDGPLLILAGPGSGKTRVVTHRTAFMIESGVPARRILTLTFTNKAADEMQTRLKNLVGESGVWTSTFHKFCSRTLRNYGDHVGLEENFTIYDAADSQKALKQTIEEHRFELFKYSPNQILNKISEFKNRLVNADEFQARPGAPLDAIVQRIYPLYQKRLLQSNAVDFDDLLLHVAKLLIDNPEVREELDARYQYISVDEYQDTNYAQYVILKMLSMDYRNLAVTGDPDQSIYGWRGANIRNILDFEKDFPETTVVRLEQNYRSTPNILEVADHLIEYNTQRKEKHLFTDRKEGIPVKLVAFPSQNDEVNVIAESIHRQITNGSRNARDIAIFYRTNSLSRNLEHSLRTLGIPYQIVKGHEFYQRREVKDILAYLHLINNPRNDVAFERIINVPSRKIGKVTIDRIKAYAHQFGVCLLEAALNCEKIATLKGNAKKNIKKFAEMMMRLRETATELVSTIITKIYLETGYRDVLLSTENQEDAERAANLDELLNAAHEFDLEYGELGGLDIYLDQASLVSDVDAWDQDDDKVTLMTLHAAKGLEFPVVYIVALEDGILPHSRSMETDSEIEEERRLFFVGITRAMEELQISRSLYRSQKGRLWPTIPSTFLMELPREKMEVHEPRRAGSEFGDDAFGTMDSDDDYSQQDHYQDPVYGDEAADDSAKTNVDETELTGQFPKGDGIPFEIFGEQTGRSPIESEPAVASGDRLPDLEGASAGLSLDSTGEETDSKSPAEPTPGSPSSSAPLIQTAAEMLEGNHDGEAVDQEPPIQLPPSAFSPNMLVSHPSYGIGRILSISAAGSKETATVDFVAIGQKKFVLAFCPLRPVVE
ncbi:MAG: UvrD-helicase domain-containing protein [Pirellulaceae bacterium]|nr:UvrD-helicase domain-containing protein [Pirellulaceae bacterium]